MLQHIHFLLLPLHGKEAVAKGLRRAVHALPLHARDGVWKLLPHNVLQLPRNKCGGEHRLRLHRPQVLEHHPLLHFHEEMHRVVVMLRRQHRIRLIHRDVANVIKEESARANEAQHDFGVHDDDIREVVPQ
ncbi:hypothetical protein DQ04_10821030 [Trypanosoma grayi]|uniref:hypothetical protein n=1 Tax=Trypanosoma grayi TaxID=71804 RepID=UPI0004F48533|nr:hypothetical protein DQ04_10821030 [Trypanosoma grayi]KEG07125.1 hypothetical protein DQ04_10821030 [Trypanosoma grayi]